MKNLLLILILFTTFCLQANAQNTRESSVYLEWDSYKTTDVFSVKLIGLSEMLNVVDNQKCKFDYVMGEDVYFTVTVEPNSSKNTIIDPIRLTIKNTNGKKINCIIYIYLTTHGNGSNEPLYVN